ncbi:MAG: hypothetical protein U0802_08460 [Candidatus Binatia bacterium]
MLSLAGAAALLRDGAPALRSAGALAALGGLAVATVLARQWWW